MDIKNDFSLVTPSVARGFAIPDIPKSKSERLKLVRRGRLSLWALDPDAALEFQGEIYGQEFLKEQRRYIEENMQASHEAKMQRWQQQQEGRLSRIYGTGKTFDEDEGWSTGGGMTPLAHTTYEGHYRPYWTKDEAQQRYNEYMQEQEVRRRNLLREFEYGTETEMGRGMPAEMALEFGRGEGQKFEEAKYRDWYASPEDWVKRWSRYEERTKQAKKLLWQVAEIRAGLGMTPEDYAQFQQYKEQWHELENMDREQDWYGLLEEDLGGLVWNQCHLPPLPLPWD